MEDIKQRLKCDDTAIRSRCIQKLVHSVKKKSKQTFTSSSPQIAELKLLWEVCIDDSTVVCNLAMQGIVHLVINGHIDLNYALNMFLSFTSSSSNVYAVVKGITKLLVYQHAKVNSSGQYSLHFQKHPLIAVLQTNDDYLSLVLENISTVICDETISGFQIMEPVIAYILSNPSKDRKLNYSKVLILETLIEAIKSESRLAFYVLRCIPFLQIESYEHVSEAASFVIKAMQQFTDFSCGNDQYVYICELFLLASLALIEKSLKYGNDPNKLINLSTRIGSSLSKQNFSSTYSNSLLVITALIMKSASGEIIESLISLTLIILDFKPLSPTISAFLAFTIIQILSEPGTIDFEVTKRSNLPQLLERLEKIFIDLDVSQDSAESPISTETFQINQNEVNCMPCFSLTTETSLQCAKFASKMDQATLTEKSCWLKAIKDVVESSTSDGDHNMIFSLTVALLLMSPDDELYVSLCLTTLEAILVKNPLLSTRMFAVLLYKQNLLKNPETRYLIIEFLPKSAIHKYAIAPVINILKIMYKDDNLKAQSIHLMLELWKKHERCFSFLSQLLLDPIKLVTRSDCKNEILLSQAAAIREVCLIVPKEHGSDFILTLSNIFKESSDEANSPVACLALDGVISLCKSELIDLRSVWKMLGPKLMKDKRIPVSCRMYSLISLVPELQVRSPEYDKFMSEILALILKQLSYEMPPEVVCAAYKALAKFPKESHLLKLLPPQAKINLHLPLSLKSTPFDLGKLVEDVLTYIPGYCYIDLLKSIKFEKSAEGYGSFLNSLIKQEVEILPKSIYNQKKNTKKQSSPKALTEVPKFLCCKMQDSKKSPSLHKNFTVGVLLSYEPPIEIGKDGEPIKRSIAAQSRFFEQVLGALLNDVNIDISDWQRSILLPGAWSSFMERTFFACEESRKAELELQRNRGLSETSSEEFDSQLNTTWLWVRDRLVNHIKTNVKNAPASQANAVLALSGLVLATTKYYGSLDEKSKVLSDKNENYDNHQKFSMEWSDTIICAMMPDYHPCGNVHSWLLTHLSRPKSSASYLVQGCSSSALCNFSSVFYNSFSDKLPAVFKHLCDGLSHDSPVLAFYSGLGLGLLIRSLCDIGYVDIGKSQVDIVLETAMQVLEVYRKNDKHSSALLCVTLLITSMSQTSLEDFKDWISTTFNSFYDLLLVEETSSMHFEMLSICTSAMIISAADGLCAPIQSIQNLSVWLEEKQSEFLQCSGISVSLGMVLDALDRYKDARGIEMKKKFHKDWCESVTSEKKPTLHKLAAMNGLCSLYSCGRGLLRVQDKEGEDATAVNEIISIMFQILDASRDIGLQSICSWEIGRLYAVHSFYQDTKASVPNFYHYLDEKSILKPLIKTILDGHTSDSCNVIISICLKSLEGHFPRPLPPLNWAHVLSPYLQHKDTNWVKSALNIAVHQAGVSSYATSVLLPYICPPLMHSLPETCFVFLLEHLHDLALSLPAPKYQIFLQTVLLVTIKQKQKVDKFEKLTLKGISKSFSQAGIKLQSLGVVRDAFISIFKHYMKEWSLFQTHLPWISEVLLLFPHETVEKLLVIPEDNSNIAILIAVSSFLVQMGKREISYLKPYIEAGKRSDTEDKGKIYNSIYQCFLMGSKHNTSEVSNQNKQIQFLTEFIGWIRVLADSKSQYQLMSANEVFKYLNSVCFATIIGCSGIECSYDLIPSHSLSQWKLLNNLAIAITKLCSRSEWEHVIHMIIDWLVSLLKSNHFKDEEKYFIKLSLCSLRHSNDFQKLDVWTNVICCAYQI